MMISGKKWNIDKVANFKEYMRETWLNKLCAIALAMLGSLPMFLDKDATCLVFMLLIAIPLFFSRKNCIY